MEVKAFHAADKKITHRQVGEKSASKKRGYEINSFHRQALLFSRRSKISRDVPVSPNLGKIRVMLLV